jgi:hypothetical protein
MGNGWQVSEGTGWIGIVGFGRISPRQDNVDGGRQYFDAQLDNGEYARVAGEHISGGPETWHFEFDQPFFLSDGDDLTLEVVISPLKGGRYAVKSRPGEWPHREPTGGWA